MSEDFEYIPTVSANEAKKTADRRVKKALLTGALIMALLTGMWKEAVFLLGGLIITNHITFEASKKPTLKQTKQQDALQNTKSGRIPERRKRYNYMRLFQVEKK